MKELVDSIIEMNINKFAALRESDKPKVGWLSIYTPEEIFIAAGIIPFRITGDQGANTTDASAMLSKNYCSYVLSCLSEGAGGCYDFAEGIVLVDACDARKRLYDVWKTKLEPNYSFLLELPKYVNEFSREYFRLQLRKLIASVESHFGCEITETSLREAIKLTNKTRRLLQTMSELRKSDHPCISGNEAQGIIKASSCGFKEEFNTKLSLLLANSAPEQAVDNNKKHRVLICGSYFDNSRIVESIERTGAIVVCEDISNGIKYFEGEIDEGDCAPIDAIADYYLVKNTCARALDTGKRLDHLMNLIEEFKVDSIIYFTLKFCDSNLIDFPYIKSKLLEAGIPVIFIEGEQHIENIENIKTRILTFLESRMF